MSTGRIREELDRLKKRLSLVVVHVLSQPPAEWSGETGRVRAEVLARHLPPGYRRFQFFICGPGPMMDAAEAALVELGVPAERVHTGALRHGVTEEQGAPRSDDAAGVADRGADRDRLRCVRDGSALIGRSNRASG
jgi:ferredoxin-NADP reductase